MFSLAAQVHSLIPLANSSNSSGIAASNNLDTSKLKTYLDEDFISILGLSSSIVAVNSSIQANASANEVGFSYGALLSSKNGSSAVSLSTSNETIGNQVRNILNEKITGKTNISSSYTQTITTTSKASMMDVIMKYTETNSTGVYGLNLIAESNFTADQSKFLSGASQLNENFSGPVGTYTAATDSSNNGALETAFTLPNSQRTVVTTQNYVKSGPGISVSPCDLSLMPPNYNPHGINFAFNNFSPSHIGPLYAWGCFEYWAQGYPAVAGLVLTGLGALDRKSVV